MHTGLVIAKGLTFALGLVVTWKAYQAYRLSGQRPMLFVAVGFSFVSFGAVIEGILFDEFGLSVFLAGSVQTAIVAVGMAFVIYSLYGQMAAADTANPG